MDLRDMRVEAVEYIGSTAGGISDTINAYPGPFLIAAAVVGSGVMLWAVLRWKENRRPKDEVEEMRRAVELEQKVADRFGDALFDMLMRGEFTRKEYKAALRKYGLGYHWRDIAMTRRNPKRGMKYRVIHNCNEMHRSLPSVPPPIPGPKPGEGLPTVAVVVRTQKKVWIAKGKAMLRLKPATT